MPSQFRCRKFCGSPSMLCGPNFAEDPGFCAGDFAANLKREISHTTLTAPGIPPPCTLHGVETCERLMRASRVRHANTDLLCQDGSPACARAHRAMETQSFDVAKSADVPNPQVPGTSTGSGTWTSPDLHMERCIHIRARVRTTSSIAAPRAHQRAPIHICAGASPSASARLQTPLRNTRKAQHLHSRHMHMNTPIHELIPPPPRSLIPSTANFGCMGPLFRHQKPHNTSTWKRYKLFTWTHTRARVGTRHYKTKHKKSGRGRTPQELQSRPRGRPVCKSRGNELRCSAAMCECTPRPPNTRTRPHNTRRSTYTTQQKGRHNTSCTLRSCPSVSL